MTLALGRMGVYLFWTPSLSSSKVCIHGLPWGGLACNAGPPDGSLYYSIITCARISIINANEKLLLDRENKGNYSYTFCEESVLAAVLASSPRREVPEDSLTEGDGKPLWG